MAAFGIISEASFRVALLRGQGEHLMKNVIHMVAECYGFCINCFSGAQVVLVLIIEAGSYSKVKELDAGQSLFQNMWFLNAHCGCLLIFHVDAIRAQYVKTEG